MSRTKHPLYGRWRGMRQRCTNPNHPLYQYYGARGITICERWDDFDNYVADVGLPPADKPDLDRINNEGNYEPSNVRWVTHQQNLANRGAFKRSDPKRNIRKTPDGYRYAVRLLPYVTYSKHFPTYKQAEDHRSLIEYEREINRRLSI